MTIVGFNGAAVFQPRKFDLSSLTALPEGLLQWGRGLSTAEILIDAGAGKKHRGASMGPRSFNRGNLPQVMRWSETVRCFNGAAVFQPRKLRLSIPVYTNFGLLQWGRGLSTAEIQPRRHRHALGDLASMGPRSFNRGNMDDLAEAPKYELASMGPRSFNRGNRRIAPSS